MSPQTDTLNLVASSSTVAMALQWLEAIGNREAWPPAVRFPLTISLDEALTNVVSYAFQKSSFLDADNRTKHPSAPYLIHLRCLIWSSQIHIEIIDNGRPYDPTKAVTQPLPGSIDNAKFGGLGLRLMRHYLSDISYSRRDNHNCLRLSVNTDIANEA